MENITVDRELTTGEKLVGINFNPSNYPSVDRAKQICAELADLLTYYKPSETWTEMESLLYKHTLGEILNAQMNVVKFLTLKY